MAEDGGRQWLVEHLAVAAVALADMGTQKDEALAQLRGWLHANGVADSSIISDAAAHISALPQPLEESAEETERARPIREMLGVASADEDLIAELTGREWLEKLANE